MRKCDRYAITPITKRYGTTLRGLAANDTFRKYVCIYNIFTYVYIRMYTYNIIVRERETRKKSVRIVSNRKRSVTKIETRRNGYFERFETDSVNGVTAIPSES